MFLEVVVVIVLVCALAATASSCGRTGNVCLAQAGPTSSRGRGRALVVVVFIALVWGVGGYGEFVRSHRQREPRAGGADLEQGSQAFLATGC